MSINSFIKSGNNLTAFVNGKPYHIDDTHSNYSKVLEAVKKNQYDLIPDLVSLASKVKTYVDKTPNTNITIDTVNGVITYQGRTLHNSLVDRILDMMREGFDVTPMTNLLINLYNNPSNKAVEELYTFLEVGKMPITPDGHFLAYKRVNDNYTSCYDNKTANNIGTIVEMPRNQVDDRSNITCSNGLHICSFDYLQHYAGARVIVVKVNPADVVSIPTDYNNTKARVCRYEVISELTPEEAGLTSHSFGTSVYTPAPTYASNNDLPPKPEDTITKVAEPIYKHEVQELLEETLLEIALQKEATPVVDTTSNWYHLGYTNGYKEGHDRKEFPSYVTAEDEPDLNLTPQQILDINSGFTVGYKDGKAHAKRKHPKVTYPFV